MACLLLRTLRHFPAPRCTSAAFLFRVACSVKDRFLALRGEDSTLLADPVFPLQGDTAFAPLKDIVHSLSLEQRRRWERLSMCSDRRGKLPHPLVYSHPVTGEDTLCFHLGE